MMIIETTQKVDAENAPDLLAGQEQVPGFIFGYVKVDKDQHTMVTLNLVSGSDAVVLKGQREVILVSSKGSDEK